MTTATDIITGDDVEILVEEVRPRSYIFRRAFRNHDATDANSDSITFDELDLDIEPEEIVEVPEESTLPRAHFDETKSTAAYTDYGFEVPISDKAIADSKLDIRANAIEQMAEAEERRMDAIAHNVLYNNTNSDVGSVDASGDAAGVLEYDDFIAVREEALDRGYNLDRLEAYASATAMSDFLNMNEFTKASELGDFVTRNANLPEGNLEAPEAFLGMCANIPVYLSNVPNNLGSGEAIVVDTSIYGYESTREAMSVDTYREEQERRDVFRAFGRLDWVATDDAGAFHIDS